MELPITAAEARPHSEHNTINRNMSICQAGNYPSQQPMLDYRVYKIRFVLKSCNMS